MSVTEMHENPLIRESQLVRAFLARVQERMNAIYNILNTEAIIIDEWKWEQSATLIQPLRDYDGPVIITSILAVYPSTTTAATINLGPPGRTIPIGQPNTGIFAVDDLRMQIGQDDAPRNLVIAPAGAAYVNFFGYADIKQVDRL